MKTHLTAILYYSALACIAIAVSLLQTPIFSYVNIDAVFSTGIKGILLLSSLILLFISGFLIQMTVFKRLIALEPNFKNRLKVLGVSMLSLVPVIIILDLPVVPSLIATASYTLFFDLFLDTKRISITWSIWWIIIIGAFLSLLIFNRINHQQDIFIQKTLEQVYTEPSAELVKNLNVQYDQIHKIELDKISTIPDPFKIASYDIEEFYKEDIQSIKENLDYDFSHFYCFDTRGKSLIEDSEFLLSQINPLVERSIQLKEDILYDPFTTALTFVFPLSNSNHPNSPFTLYIVLSKEKNNQTFTNYQLYNGNTYYKQLNPIYPEIFNFRTADDMTLSDGKKFIGTSFPNGFNALSARDVTDLIKPISLFSYLFVIILMITSLLLLLNTILPILPNKITTDFFFNSLQNKLQITVILLIVVSFIFIGIVTIFYFNRMSERYAYNMLERKLDMSMRLFKQSNVDINTFQNTINDLHFAEDIHLYLIDNEGEVITSNHGAPLMAYDNLQQDTLHGLRQFDHNGLPTYSMTGKLAISNSDPLYIKIVSDNPSDRISYVNDFMGTLINIYVFLFIIAGAIAIFISKPITDPITAIGERMRQLKLGKENKPLSYSKNDELGALVNEYNQMITKLDSSSKLIAQTERDMAWREMAKQVAHEIKNPLTPMKLSIQYLQRAISVADADPQVLVKRISHTLIEQIDNLTQIANEFSSFGTLPQGNNDKVSLNEVVEAIHDLFRKRDDMDIYLEEPIDDVIVFADKHHLIRILNNLVKNAMQAIPENRRGKIHLKLYQEQNKAFIKVSDNGTGIPDYMKDKVFTPNFTTKNSGTGLGLAISANMIESFNGKIYFETEENVGTDFYIEIPLMRSEEAQIEAESLENRVYLD